jgi:hypothetical protein
MKKATKTTKPRVREDMRTEYNFSGGVRGKYAARFAAASGVSGRQRTVDREVTCGRRRLTLYAPGVRTLADRAGKESVLFVG